MIGSMQRLIKHAFKCAQKQLRHQNNKLINTKTTIVMIMIMMIEVVIIYNGSFL